jgi:DNA sulfur modification protein DndE
VAVHCTKIEIAFLGSKQHGMKMKNKFLMVFGALLIFYSCHPLQPVCLYLIGDSTVADKPLQDNPERGWGQILPQFFTDKIRIYNHARNGRSTKSFINEGLWQKVLDSLQSGDFVMIQFGHNDQKISDSTRYADAHGAFRNNMIRFITDARAKGAQPVLITPVVRRRFDEQGKFYDVHGDYPGVVREIAKERHVPLIDLHQASREMITREGVEGSKRIFLWLEPGQYTMYPQGKQDNTHFTEYGARCMALLVVEGVKKLDLKLKKYLLGDNIK